MFPLCVSFVCVCFCFSLFFFSNRQAIKHNQETEQKTSGQSAELIRTQKSFQQPERQHPALTPLISWLTFRTPDLADQTWDEPSRASYHMPRMPRIDDISNTTIKKPCGNWSCLECITWEVPQVHRSCRSQASAKHCSTETERCYSFSPSL